MSVVNPYIQYQQNAVTSAEPGQLTLMLYNGALKFNTLAIKELEAKNIEQTNHYIQRVQAIISELTVTLNQEFKVSQNLLNLYQYLNERLVEANVKKNKQILLEVHSFLEELRDAWNQALKKIKTESAVNTGTTPKQAIDAVAG
ncbi:MAG: flagellar export chaperone FliS [Desulfotomaculum sp.]|nr:flagellar export chaperone FliS [Desulfotomaculum sp.]